MTYAVAGLAVIVFMIALAVLRIVSVASTAVRTSRSVISTLSDQRLDDTYREQALQKASLSLLGNFVSITLRGAAALLASYVVIYVADTAGIVGSRDVMELLASPEAILVTTVILTAAWIIWKKR
jgi:hypothetical protein